jgi:hypothetical protein
MLTKIFFLPIIILFQYIAYAQPTITIIGGTNADFGTLYRGERIEKKLTIKNEGNDTLNIANVSASCGCTAAMMSEKIIAPGDSGTLNVGFNSENFSGKVQKIITITSNDPQNSALQFRFGVNILEELSVDPRTLIIREAKKNENVSTTLKIKNTSKSPISLLSWSSENKNVSMELPQEPLQPSEETTLTIKYSCKEAGYVNSTFDIVTDAKRQSKLTVNFYINILSAQ